MPHVARKIKNLLILQGEGKSEQPEAPMCPKFREKHDENIYLTKSEESRNELEDMDENNSIGGFSAGQPRMNANSVKIPGLATSKLDKYGRRKNSDYIEYY